MPRVGKDLLGFSGSHQTGARTIYRGAKSGAKSAEDPLSTMTGYLGGTRIPFRDFRWLEAGLRRGARTCTQATF